MPKYADVYYPGRMRSGTKRTPRGVDYEFTVTQAEGPLPTPVHNLEDALYFEEEDWPVEWTPYGEFAKRVYPAGGSIKEAIRDLSYRQKQNIVTALDLDVSGNARESTMNKALRDFGEELADEIDNERL